jgi:hypothetical protein
MAPSAVALADDPVAVEPVSRAEFPISGKLSGIFVQIDADGQDLGSKFAVIPGGWRQIPDDWKLGISIATFGNAPRNEAAHQQAGPPLR